MPKKLGLQNEGRAARPTVRVAIIIGPLRSGGGTTDRRTSLKGVVQDRSAGHAAFSRASSLLGREEQGVDKAPLSRIQEYPRIKAEERCVG